MAHVQSRHLRPASWYILVVESVSLRAWYLLALGMACFLVFLLYQCLVVWRITA